MSIPPLGDSPLPNISPSVLSESPLIFKILLNWIELLFKKMHKQTEEEKADEKDALRNQAPIPSEEKARLKELDHMMTLAMKLFESNLMLTLIRKYPHLAAHRDALGNFPMHIAILRKDLDLLRQLLQYPTHITHPNKAGETPLHLALATNQMELFKLMLQAPGIKMESSLFQSLLAHAIINGQQEAIQALIPGKEGEALAKALASGASLTSAQKEMLLRLSLSLLQKGEKANLEQLLSRFPELLSFAKEKGISLADKEKLALQMAKERENMAASTKKELGEEGKLAPFMPGREAGRMENFAPPEKGHREEEQKEPDDDPLTEVDDDALIEAARYGNLRYVLELLARGAEIDRQNSQGETALMLASQKGHDEIVKALLDKGANPSIRNKKGKKASDLSSHKCLYLLEKQLK